MFYGILYSVCVLWDMVYCVCFIGYRTLCVFYPKCLKAAFLIIILGMLTAWLTTSTYFTQFSHIKSLCFIWCQTHRLRRSFKLTLLYNVVHIASDLRLKYLNTNHHTLNVSKLAELRSKAYKK